jgi:hypothetical protein
MSSSQVVGGFSVVRGDHIYVAEAYVSAVDDIQSRMLEVEYLAAESGIRRVFVDARNTRGDFTAGQWAHLGQFGVEHVQVLEKIAILRGEVPRSDPWQGVVDALADRGFECRLFADETEALAWLKA